LNDAKQEFNHEATLCIIGAGAAGLTIAKKLGTKVKNIILLESGGIEYDHATQSLYKGKVSGIPYFPLESVRLRYFGGSTNHWGGQSIPMEPYDFKLKPWVKDSGWPIKYKEIERYLGEAVDVCGIPAGSFEWEEWSKKSGKGAYPLHTAIFKEALLRFSSPAKRFGIYYKKYIENSENIKCILNANVLCLCADESGKSIGAVNVSTVDKKRKVKIKADYFVLACGGIENSRLLLLSDDVHKKGIGNTHDMVGRYFMEHPNYDSGEIRVNESVKKGILGKPFYKVNGGLHRVDFKLRNDIQEKEKILNHTAFFVDDSMDQHGTLNKQGFFSKAWKKVKAKLFQGDNDWRFKLRVRLEHAPYSESRIVLSDELDSLGQRRARLNMYFGELEARTIEKVQQMFAVELGRLGLGRMKIEFDPIKNPEWKKNVGWQYHHCGGTRMSNNPETGVVDVDCKVHGVDNLYIAGSSVFPSSGHANPTLNLVALALRLSDKLSSIILK